MSITLTNAAVLNINGAVAESDPNASLYYMEISFIAGTTGIQARLFYGYGATSGQTFSPGNSGSSLIPKVIVTVNLVTGAWSSNTGLSGTVSGAGFTAVQNDILALANIAETFAVNNNIIDGTQVSWTAGAF